MSATKTANREGLSLAAKKEGKTLRQRVEEFYGVDFETVIKEGLHKSDGEWDTGEPAPEEIF